MSAVVVLLVPGFVATAAAAPGSSQSRSAASDTAATGSEQPFPPNNDLLYVQTALAPAARAGRVKLNITVPATVAIGAGLFNPTKEKYFPPLDKASGLYAAPAGFEPARPKPGCLYTTGEIIAWVWPVDARLGTPPVDPNAPTTPADPAGPAEQGKVLSVGSYPPVPVSFLAFGSIPVRAVLHLRQPRLPDGRPEPLAVEAVGGVKSIRAGDPDAFAGDGRCDERWETDISNTGLNPTIVTGRAELTVSDVTVDGQSVPVGKSCRTATPLQLHLNGASYNGIDPNDAYVSVLDGGLLTQQRNTATIGTTRLGVYPGSRNLTIPPFIGCRSPQGDDISRLVTSFVSGSDNALAVRQTTARNNLDPNHPSRCPAADQTCRNFPDPVRPPVPGG